MMSSLMNNLFQLLRSPAADRCPGRSTGVVLVQISISNRSAWKRSSIPRFSPWRFIQRRATRRFLASSTVFSVGQASNKP